MLPKTFLRIPLLALALLLPLQARADRAETLRHRGVDYDVYAVSDPARIRYYWRDAEGRDFRTFDRVRDAVEKNGGSLAFAANGGMFHPDHRPVGLFVEDGQTLSPLNLDKGKGNFFLRPGGVFYVSAKGAGLLESRRFAARPPKVRMAAQSGPMLVLDGAIRPGFTKGSTFRHVRNGVGVDPKGQAVFVISRSPVNFYELASFFREVLHCRDALYLDGALSAVYAPVLGRRPLFGDYGPIIGVLAPK